MNDHQCELPPTSPGLGMLVLQSGTDISRHAPNSGAELLHSSLAGRDSVTVCVRLAVQQFTHQGYSWPGQVFLHVRGRKEGLLESYSMTEQVMCTRLFTTCDDVRRTRAPSLTCCWLVCGCRGMLW